MRFAATSLRYSKAPKNLGAAKKNAISSYHKVAYDFSIYICVEIKFDLTKFFFKISVYFSVLRTQNACGSLTSQLQLKHLSNQFEVRPLLSFIALLGQFSRQKLALKTI